MTRGKDSNNKSFPPATAGKWEDVPNHRAKLSSKATNPASESIVEYIHGDVERVRWRDGTIGDGLKCQRDVETPTKPENKDSAVGDCGCTLHWQPGRYGRAKRFGLGT
jgi:hypothetical protein